MLTRFVEDYWGAYSSVDLTRAAAPSVIELAVTLLTAGAGTPLIAANLGKAGGLIEKAVDVLQQIVKELKAVGQKAEKKVRTGRAEVVAVDKKVAVNYSHGIAAPGPVNFMSDSDRFFVNISERFDVDPEEYFDVVAHGSPHRIQVETLNGPVLVDHRIAARLIREQSGYNGQKIRLFSCSTGACSTGFAQNLANKLNVEVQAPSDLLWVYPNGKTLIAPQAANGQPDLSNLGETKIFSPKKNQ